MDLQTLKDTYAQEQGYKDWGAIRFHPSTFERERHWTEICIRAQKAYGENVAKNAKLVPLQGIGFIDFSKQMLDKHSITNPENLIR